MIRYAIKTRIKQKGMSIRKVAIDCGLTYQNFHSFLSGSRALPIPDIEKVLAYLELEIRPVEELQ